MVEHILYFYVEMEERQDGGLLNEFHNRESASETKKRRDRERLNVFCILYIEMEKR